MKVFTGINVEGAHLLPSVIANVSANSRFYADATLPFPVREGEKLFAHYKDKGYDFDVSPGFSSEQLSSEHSCKLIAFFKSLGKAKHEPCGEHWDHTYAESAWRLSVLAMCLQREPGVDKERLVRTSLSSSLTR